MAKPLSFLGLICIFWKNFYFFMAKFIPIGKTFIFWQIYTYIWIKLKNIFSTKYFNKTFCYPIDITTILMYLHHWPNFLFIWVHHLLIIYKMQLYTIIWYTKYEGIALNELTTILIIFDPLMSINGNCECK